MLGRNIPLPINSKVITGVLGVKMAKSKVIMEILYLEHLSVNITQIVIIMKILTQEDSSVKFLESILPAVALILQQMPWLFRLPLP